MRNEYFREGLQNHFLCWVISKFLLLIEVRDDFSLDQSGTVETMRKGQILPCFEYSDSEIH